jgi:hypothetical protein
MISRRITNSCWSICLLWCVIASVSLLCGAEENEQANASVHATVGPGVKVDLTKREVHIEATFCRRHGILEFICAPKEFDHESIFTSTVKGSHVHAALLLIGAEPFPYSPADNWPNEVRQHPKCRLTILAEYDDYEGNPQRYPISNFIRNTDTKDGLVPNEWAFTGSVFYVEEGKELYAADTTGCIIGLIDKGASVVQFAELVSDPNPDEQEGLVCRTEEIPKPGTEATIIFSLAPPSESKPIPPPVNDQTPSAPTTK